MIGKHALLMLALAGCGAAGAAQGRDRLTREVEELRRRTDSDRHAVHELENRVFILEDKLDTAEVARARTDAVPKLPVVVKKAEPPPPLQSSEPRSEPLAATEPEEQVGAETETEAEARRPPIVIRMDGHQGGGASVSHAGPRTASVPLDLASVNERLPVVPMPKRGATAPAPAPGPVPAPAGDAMAAYQGAYAALGRREHAVAIAAFRAFLEKWPTHDYADNAQYWLGEAYYDQADFQTALSEFKAVLKRYPDGNKAPDALLKVGFCMGKLGDTTGARDVLAQVTEIYPKTDAARLATQRLAEMSGRQP